MPLVFNLGRGFKKYKYIKERISTHLHLVLRFWNQVLTWASVILRLLARAALSALARYFWRWKRFSNSHICTLEKDVRGFFLLGGVRFWYGWPIRRVTENGTRAAGWGRKDTVSLCRTSRIYLRKYDLCKNIVTFSRGAHLHFCTDQTTSEFQHSVLVCF